MPGKPCAEVRQLLRTAARVGSVTPPSSDVIGHIAGCSTCRGALALLLRDLLGGPQMPSGISCAVCQEHIAAYAELQAEAGAAFRAYPAVGWHLWTCAECAVIYEMTEALLEAERAGRLQTIPVLRRGPVGRRLLATIRLARSFLSRALPAPPLLLGDTRGDEDAEGTLYETEAGHYLISFGVQRQQDSQWMLRVTIDPAADGWLTMTIDDRTNHVRINDGIAVVPDVPDAALGAPDGPDLVGQIEIDTSPP